jgi:phosphoglycerate dehydrogenase-like enzyme
LTGPADPGLRHALEQLGLRIEFVETIRASPLGDVDAVLHLSLQPLSRAFLAQFRRLRAVAVIGATHERIEVLAKPHPVLIGTESWDVEDAAEHALSLLYTARFKLAEGAEHGRDPAWVEAHSFKGAKVGIVGLGRLGEAFARRVSTARMDVSWWGPRLKVVRWTRADSLMDRAERSDILFVSCPSGPATRGLVRLRTRRTACEHRELRCVTNPAGTSPRRHEALSGRTYRR